MTIRAAFTAAAIALALSACNTLQTQGRGKPEQKLDCRSANSCQVQVSASCSLGCYVSVDAYAVIVSVKNGKDSIAWQLPKDSTFAFAPNDQGVVFDEEGKRAFRCNTEQDGRRITCKSRDPNFAVYKYTLNVIGPFGVSMSLDPWVINN
jgi:hypothetical protein